MKRLLPRHRHIFPRQHSQVDAALASPLHLSRNIAVIAAHGKLETGDLRVHGVYHPRPDTTPVYEGSRSDRVIIHLAHTVEAQVDSIQHSHASTMPRKK